MNNRAITVSQLNNYIKQVFDAEELLHNVEVIGEIIGLKQSGNAVYFTLKDDMASINCVCFYPGKMKDADNGKQVVVRGTVGYWHKAGKISFSVHHCESFGFGQLFLKFKQLQEKLQQEGLFEAGTKKVLPAEVKRIGVVTSRTGAVLHDIASVAHRRNPSADIVIYDTLVQGEGAEQQISDAIELFNSMSHVDIIIVARGGGSKDDLNAFNSERVARAVFASKIPIVSAVGHENDWTLIDFVADLRAATPSAAAELCIPEILTLRENTMRSWNTLRAVMTYKADALATAAQTLWLRLRSNMFEKIQAFENRAASLASYCEANNPIAVLRRGFAKTNKMLDELKEGDEFEIMFYNKSQYKKGIAKWIKSLSN